MLDTLVREQNRPLRALQGTKDYRRVFPNKRRSQF